MIVTVTHTVMDGQVAWFYPASLRAVDIGYAEPGVSASRSGVMGHGGWITPEMFAAAWAAHERLKRREDVRDIQTHVREHGIGGQYIPVAEPADARPEGDDR